MFAGAYTAEERVQWPIRNTREEEKNTEKKIQERKKLQFSLFFLKERFTENEG